MELRQNVYFILLYAIMLGMLIIFSIFIYVRISEMEKNINLYKNIYDAIQKSLNVYYSGAFYKYKNDVLSSHDCFSRYDSKMRLSIYCDNKKLILFSINYPLLLSIHKGNNQIYIERGSIDYLIFKYFYVLVTNKRIMFIRFNIDNSSIQDEKLENLLVSFFLNIPSSNIVAFYDKNKYFIICNTKDLEKCDKYDFISSTIFRESIISSLINYINIDSKAQYSTDAIHKLRRDYEKYDPIFVAIVDDEHKCGINENCLVYKKDEEDYPLKYVYVNEDGTKIEKKIKEGYEIMLLTLFKEMYGRYNKKTGHFMVEDDIYREMWIDYISFYAPILSQRYALLKEKKEYSYESYEVCKDYFEQISQLLCNSTQQNLCNAANKKEDKEEKINEIYDILLKIMEVGKKIIKEGCEEKVFS